MVQLSSTEKLQTVCTILFLVSSIRMVFHVPLHVSFAEAPEVTNVTGIAFDFEVNRHLMLLQVSLPLTLEAAARMIAGKGSSIFMNDSNMLSHASPT